MKKTATILILLQTAALIMAAGITGRVLDANDKPMPFVTISLMQSDSTIVDGAISDEQGKYYLSGNYPPSQYTLSVSFIGYQTIHQPLEIKECLIMDFRMEEETEQLNEVEVKAKKPLVERQMDKLVLNVSSSAFAIGSNGQDVLKKAPGVRIDQEGNITVNGKSVEVYIDGRPSYLSGEQLKGMLQGTAGATIEKIEIITNPSAKYDASGQGGIINIKLKKNMMKGFNGMLAGNYGGMYFRKPDKYYQQEYAALNINYRSAKTYSALSLTQVYAHNGVEFASYSQMPLSDDTMCMGSNLSYDVHFQYYELRATHDFYINDKNTLGLIFNAPVMRFNSDATSKGEYGSYITLGELYLNKSLTEGGQANFSPQHSANINFTHVFADSCSQELTANIDYNRYNSHALNFQKNTDVETFPLFESLPALDITTDQIVNIYSAKVDFQSGFCRNGFVETGAKYALSVTDNCMTMDSTLVNQNKVHDTIAYRYSEEVSALYLTASWQFNEKWSLKAGLRGEFSHSPYISRFDLFPTAFIGFNPAQEWRLSASYTRRIKRPGYWQLNPFKSYVSAHAYQQGYPGLQPEFNNQVDFTFGWSQYVSLAANFSHTQNMMHRKGEVLPNGDICSKWMNFGTCTTHGVNISFTEIPLVPKKDAEGKMNGAWLALTFNAGYYNFISRAYYEDYLQRSHYANCNGALTAYLPEDIQIALDGWYSAPMTMGYQYSSASGAMGLAIKKTFPKQQLTITMNVNDILRSTFFTQEDRGLAEGYASRIEQEVHQQSINIGLTYMFGQQQWHKYRKVGQTDETGRLGGGGGVGSR